MELQTRPIGPHSWDDVAAVFAASSGSRECWCMQWRTAAAAYQRNGADGNRAALRELVESGAPVGVLGYDDGVPVGWCSVSPRPDYPRIVRSPALKLAELDRDDVWSVACFFTAAWLDHADVVPALLDGAMVYAARSGATVLEAYPGDPTRHHGSVHGGSVKLLGAAGFELVAEPGGARVVMRRELSA